MFAKETVLEPRLSATAKVISPTKSVIRTFLARLAKLRLSKRDAEQVKVEKY